jgi:Flp pilus assembly protein TadD
VLFLYQTFVGGSSSTRPGPRRPTRPVASTEVARKPLEKDLEEVLEKAALAALDRRMVGLPAAPPPKVALRGDLDELHSLLARVARGEQLEPILERWVELNQETSRQARKAAHLLARIDFLLGRVADSKKYLEKALALNPGVADLHALYGKILVDQDDLGGAEESFRVAIGLDPECALAHGGLARVLGLMGKDREAREALVKALSLQPENPELHYDMGMALRVEGRFAEAAEHLEIFLRVRPDDAYGQWFLAEALQQTGREREATEAKMKAYKLGYQDEGSAEGP